MKRAFVAALASSWAIAGCTVEARPFADIEGRRVANAYGVTPTAFVGPACPSERPLDNTPCEQAVTVGSHCEYASGPKGDVEYVSPAFSVHTRCVSESSTAPRWITVTGETAPGLCGEGADAGLACSETVCRNYAIATCGCAATEARRVNDVCPIDASGCPALRPHHGQPCVGGQYCDYDGCGKGALMQCLGNVWQMALAVCP